MSIARTIARGALALGAVSAGAQGSIAGTVYDSLRTHAPLANATVVLVEPSRYATTDARGRFRMDSVPDGHYTVGFMHPVLDSLDLQVSVVAVDVAGGRRATVTLSSPSLATAYARMCPGARDSDTGIIIGRVRDVDEQSSLAGATVSTAWTEFTITGGHPVGHRARVAARTNAEGVYMLCGVPIRTSLDVYTERGGFIAGPALLSLDDRLISRVDFAISRKDSAARIVPGDSAKVAAGAPGTASLHGSLRFADGRPAHDAVIEVLGTLRSAHADSGGTFRIDRIPAGTRTVAVKSIGMAPVVFSVDFATNATRDTTVSITRQAQELKPVVVKGGSRSR